MHKIVAFNVSHGFQGKYWEKGETGSASEAECRKDEDGSLLPPPHFHFADGSKKKAASEKAEKPPKGDKAEKSEKAEKPPKGDKAEK